MNIDIYKHGDIGSKLLSDPESAISIAEILKAIAHPVRLQIVALLCNGEWHVNALAQQVGVKQAIISQHLRILRMRGLVEVVRSNGFSYYALAEPKLQELIQCMEGCSIR